jgi:hypothetical protein
LLVHFQDQIRRMRPLAAQWAHDLAEVELDKAARVEAQLEQAGHTLPDGPSLMTDARQRLQTCAGELANGDSQEAYAEAQRVLRPVRILMRAQWEQAIRGLESAVASPYAVSFFTLPQHWRFVEELTQTTPGANLLPGGDFEASTGPASQGWVPQDAILDEVIPSAQVVAENPKEGKQCLLMSIQPKNPLQAPDALERTFLALNSPAVQLPPGTLVKISAWVRIPAGLVSSIDGALFYDSIGGEPLGYRLSGPTGWKKLVLYRRVPASGTVRVTLATTAMGKVYFDNVRIEPLLPKGTVQTPMTEVPGR